MFYIYWTRYCSVVCVRSLHRGNAKAYVLWAIPWVKPPKWPRGPGASPRNEFNKRRCFIIAAEAARIGHVTYLCARRQFGAATCPGPLKVLDVYVVYGPVASNRCITYIWRLRRLQTISERAQVSPVYAPQDVRTRTRVLSTISPHYNPNKQNKIYLIGSINTHLCFSSLCSYHRARYCIY